MTDNSAIVQTERLTMQRSFAEIAFDCRPKMTKRQFGYLKTRYSGMAKNSAQIVTLFALANIYHARYHLGAVRP